jgi:hypothetical protein
VNRILMFVRAVFMLCARSTHWLRDLAGASKMFVGLC